MSKERKDGGKNMHVHIYTHTCIVWVKLERSLLTATFRICWLPRFPSCWIRALNSSVFSSGNWGTSFSKRDRTSDRLQPAPTQTPAEKPVCEPTKLQVWWRTLFQICCRGVLKIPGCQWQNRKSFVLAGRIIACTTAKGGYPPCGVWATSNSSITLVGEIISGCRTPLNFISGPSTQSRETSVKLVWIWTWQSLIFVLFFATSLWK